MLMRKALKGTLLSGEKNAATKSHAKCSPINVKPKMNADSGLIFLHQMGSDALSKVGPPREKQEILRD